MATCSLDLTLATSPLPLCRITARVEDCEHHDEITFDREVHRVGKSPEQRATDASPKGLILERPTSDPIIGSEQLVEKRNTQPGSSFSYHWYAAATSRSTRGSATSRYSITDAGWSGDCERHEQGARGSGLGDTRRAVLEQG